MKINHITQLFLLCAGSMLHAEDITILHVGDQESWLLSAQGNLRDDAGQSISYYGGIDRLASVIARARDEATTANRFVLTLNAGDSFLPGPRLTASLDNLASAYPADGGQDFYDAIANRHIGFDAIIFGNHEFDLGPDIAARFADVSESTYLSMNLNFQGTPAFAALEAAGKIGASKIISTPAGHKIGIIGVTTPLLPYISSPGAITLTADFSSANTEQQNLVAMLPHIQGEIDFLRSVEGVHLVIIISHLQNANNEINTMIPGLTGVDLVISGGGHELMTDADDLLISGGVAPTFTTHPIYVMDASATEVPLVTGHFGNRYVGVVELSIDSVTGVSPISNTRMVRVTGRSTDADRVDGDSTLYASIVQPILTYISALNAQIIGTTAVKLNGARGTTGTPGNYTEGQRNAETNLGNLVADALRFAGEADIAIQNGGGVRADINGPGNVSVGDTFNVLPFTNLVKTARSVNATQLKAILEHAYGGANTTPDGKQEGRFGQISGMKVWYNSTQPSGNRIRRVVLDNGTVLVDNYAVVDTTSTFALATIDFLANGGDGYPYAANGIVFENATYSITYQEALAEFIETPKAMGGLGRASAADGDEITTNMYGVENAFDMHGRLIDDAVAVAAPGQTFTGTMARNRIRGTANDDTINGRGGPDILWGAEGGDTFVYASILDGSDTIMDFTPYADKLDVRQLLTSFGYNQGKPFADGYLSVRDGVGGAVVTMDSDGKGRRGARVLCVLRGLTAAQIVPARDFLY